MMDSQEESLLERSQLCLDKKFVCQNRQTFFRPKSGSSPELFVDGVLKIQAKISTENAHIGYFLFRLSDKTKTKSICLSAAIFYDVTKFLTALNSAFGGGSFIIGNIKTSDLRDYFRWLKDEFDNGNEKTLKMAPYIGYMPEDSQWVLNDNVHLAETRVLNEADASYYIVKDQLDGFQLEFEPQLTNYEYFSSVWKRILDMSDSLKENKSTFISSIAFVLKTYLNSYTEDRTDAGETRFAMFVSESMSCGKTSAMKLIASGQGVPGGKQSYLMAGGDGNKCGTTPKQIKERSEKTNLFLFLNDYAGNKLADEVLLQTHDGFSQASGTSESKISRAAIFLTSNMDVKKRLDGRVIQYLFKRSSDFSVADKLLQDELTSFCNANKGFLIAWCFHFGRIWFDEICVELKNIVFGLLLENFLCVQTRVAKAWASIILCHYLVLASDKRVISLTDILEEVAAEFIESSGRGSGIVKLEKELLKRIATDEEVEGWLKIGTYFSDSESNNIDAISIATEEFSKFPDINGKSLMKSFVDKFGGNCNRSVDFVNPDGTTKSKRALKIPENEFTNEGISKIFAVFGKEYPIKKRKETRLVISSEIQEQMLFLEVRLSREVKNLVREKSQVPGARTTETQFVEDVLTPKSRRLYLSSTAYGKSMFRKGYFTCKRKELFRSPTESESSSSGKDSSDED